MVAIVQLLTTADISHNKPLPMVSKPPFVLVCPPANVKPVMNDFVPAYTQRTAASPFVVSGSALPMIVVNVGPLTLRNVIAFVIATRLVNDPPDTRPPVAYTPLLTKTNAPA